MFDQIGTKVLMRLWRSNVPHNFSHLFIGSYEVVRLMCFFREPFGRYRLFLSFRTILCNMMHVYIIFIVLSFFIRRAGLVSIAHCWELNQQYKLLVKKFQLLKITLAVLTDLVLLVQDVCTAYELKTDF